MLSAVEHLGPLVGAVTTLPYVRLDHCYITNVINNANTASIAPIHVPFTPANLIQLNALQSIKLQQQYERHLSSYLPPSPPISNIAALPHRSLQLVSVVATDTNIERNILAPPKDTKSPSQHREQPQEKFYSTNFTWQTKSETSSTSQQEKEQAIMSTSEFTPPHPKHQNQSTNNLMPPNVDHGPMNLATNANTSVCNTTLLVTENSRPSSSSSSVDVENDESMSPISVPTQGRRILEAGSLSKQQQQQQLAYDENNVTTATAVMAAYQFNYSQMYPGRPALYNAPVLFSSHHPHPTMASHPGSLHSHTAPFLSALSGHSNVATGESNIYTAEYFKALQNAVAVNVFQSGSTGTAFPGASPTNINTIYSKSNQHNPLTDPMLALTPAGPPNALATIPLATAVARQKGQVGINKEELLNTKSSTGTYLYDKVKTSPTETADAENYFKIPSGKEGSLKHRILTRPLNLEKQESGKVPLMRTHNSTSNFKKGSFIDLANGVLRRVEDMRTEDFIQCADRSTHHQLIESTVVKINSPQPNTVVISFSYDRNRSKAEIEVSNEHPFFVYGQGWASCNPDLSFKSFGLKCQRLQVGDICISLTKRDPTTTSKDICLPGKEQNDNNKMIISQANIQKVQHELQSAVTDNVVPNMAANTFSGQFSVASQYSTLRNMTAGLYMPNHLTSPSPYTTIVDMSFCAAAQSDTEINSHLSPKMMDRFHERHEQEQMIRASDQRDTSTQDSKAEHDELSLFRKRRWSAPDSFSNSDEDEGENYEPPQRLPSAGGHCYRTFVSSKMPSSRSDCDSSLFK